MTNSQYVTKRSMSIWQFILLITAAYLTGVYISHQTTASEKVYWSGFKLELMNDGQQWVESDRMQIGKHSSIQDVRFKVMIDDSDKWKRPVGLIMGGPFSAEVFWNEHKLGGKGIIGNTLDEETVGPIDFVTFIPSELLKLGEHHIRVRMSTQHLLAGDDLVFHYIWLAPYRESGRRDLRYYSAPLIVLSALVLLSFQSFRIGRNAGNALHIGMGGYGFSIAVMLLSEVSRALINYPYPWHELRGLIGWCANIAAGMSLMYTCLKTTPGRLSTIVLSAGILIIIASYFIPMNSGDMRLAQDFILLVSAPALVFTILLFKRNISYLTTLPLFWLACLVSNTFSTGLFLDSFQFIASLILIAGAWLWVYVDVSTGKQQQPETAGCHEFVICSAGEKQVIAVKDCFALKGEGNYTSLMLFDGRTALHQDGLGAIMDTNPVDFIRVHKSWAVDLNAVKKLRSAEGSKYWVEMRNGETVPVSRYRVAELRGLLKQE